MQKLGAALAVVSMLAFLFSTPRIDTQTGSVTLGNEAFADIGPPPPPPPPPPTPKASSSDNVESSNKGKVTAESILQWQGAAIGCSSVVNIVDSQVTARTSGRELTPLGAIDNGARCTLVPATLVSLWSRLAGIKDDACTYDVATRALQENNSPQARQELLWRDGSWERRQMKFLEEYRDCYRGVQKTSLQKSKKYKKKHKLHHRR